MEVLRTEVARDGLSALPLEVYVPEDGGPFPVVVFSHGAGGSGDCCKPLVERWASHGYVVVAPTHDDSVKLRMSESSGRGRAREARRLLIDAVRMVAAPEGRERRVADVKTLLDALPVLMERHEELRGKLDVESIGMSGHSAGALTGQLIAGVKSFVDGEALELGDARPDAFVLLSPQGISEGVGFTEDSWRDLGGPTLFVTGSEDAGIGGQDPEWRKQGYERAPAGDKYLLFIEGAAHSSFTGTALERPNRRMGSRMGRRGGQGNPMGRALRAGSGDTKKIVAWTATTALAFWDAYLKDDTEARSFLASDAMMQASEGDAVLSGK
ncbi:MAG: hypothetical protein AAGD38_11565 [Acidobacteriota bacterium]